jgi:hypothetical protein
MKRLLAGIALVAGLGFGASPAEANFRCSSYSYQVRSPTEICRITCIYCLDEDTGVIFHETCYVANCWSWVI